MEIEENYDDITFGELIGLILKYGVENGKLGAEFFSFTQAEFLELATEKKEKLINEFNIKD